MREAMIPAMARLKRSVAILAWLAASACTTVQPWERGVLAHPSMDPGANNEICSEDFLRHTFDVREGATGGTGHAGGGCGCN